MDSIIQFLQQNFIWIIVICAFIIFTVIGYFVDKSEKKKYKEQIRKENDALGMQQQNYNYQQYDNQNQEYNYQPEQSYDYQYQQNESQEYNAEQQYQNQGYDYQQDSQVDDNTMATDFLTGDNYDLGNIRKDQEQQPIYDYQYQQNDNQEYNEVGPQENYQNIETQGNYESSQETQNENQEYNTEYNTVESQENYENTESQENYEPAQEYQPEEQINTVVIPETEEQNIEVPVQEINTKNEDYVDDNLSYLLGDSNQTATENESIDDFLQRTINEVNETNNNEEVSNSDIDYEDTLPIPIQQQDADFSNVSVEPFEQEKTEEQVKIEEEPKKKKGLFGLFGKKKKKKEKEENPTVEEEIQPEESKEDNTVIEEQSEEIPIEETTNAEVQDEQQNENTEEQQDFDLTKLFENKEPEVETQPEGTSENQNIKESNEQIETPVEEPNEESDDDSPTAQIDFKPIEDAILESLGRLSEKDN